MLAAVKPCDWSAVVKIEVVAVVEIQYRPSLAVVERHDVWNRFFFFGAHIGMEVATPNDPKLSDSGPGARMGARRRKAKARAVPGFMAGRTARD